MSFALISVNSSRGTGTKIVPVPVDDMCVVTTYEAKSKEEAALLFVRDMKSVETFTSNLEEEAADYGKNEYTFLGCSFQVDQDIEVVMKTLSSLSSATILSEMDKMLKQPSPSNCILVNTEESLFRLLFP